MSEQILKKSLELINKDNELKSNDNGLKSKDHLKSSNSNKLKKLKKMRNKSKKEADQNDKLKFVKSTSLIEQFKKLPEKRKLKLERNKEKLKQIASIKIDKSFSKTLFKDFNEETNQDKKSKKSVFTEDDFLEFERQFVMN